METGLVFNRHGGVIAWHVPEDRSAGFLPDSPTLWQILWANRVELGGFAHTHPGEGIASPSTTDVTTFAAIELALGKRLVWPILTFAETVYTEWVGPSALAYTVGYKSQAGFELPHELLAKLRDLSR